MDRFAYILRRLAAGNPGAVRRHRARVLHDPPRAGRPGPDDARRARHRPRRVAALHHEWGLDRSLPAQYWLFSSRAAPRQPRHVALLPACRTASLIIGRLPATLWLIGYGDDALDHHRACRSRCSRRRDKDRARATRSSVRCRWSASGSRRSGSGSCCCCVFGLHLGRLFPVGGYGERLRRAPALDVPAGAHGRARHLAAPDPQPAREHARGARVRLRHDGPLEGALRAAGARRATRCATRSSRRSPCSASTSRFLVGGTVVDRAGVRAAGHRPAHAELDLPARLPGRAGRHARVRASWSCW